MAAAGDALAEREPGPEPAADAVPEQSADDTDEGWGEVAGSADDARYLEDRPPHWEP